MNVEFQTAVEQEVQARLARMQQELQQKQQAEIQYLAGKLAALEAREQRPTVDRTVTIDNFDGSSDVIDTWLLQLELATKAFSDAQRMDLAEQHFRGSALLWLHELQCTGVQRPEAWREWKARLQKRFEPINADERYRQQLAELRQTGSLQLYTQQFSSLCLRLPDITGRQKIFQYIRGLREAVRQEVQARRPASFDDAVQLADHFDDIRSHGVAAWTAPPSSATAGLQSSAPMEVSMVQDPGEVAYLRTTDRQQRPGGGFVGRRAGDNRQAAQQPNNAGCFYCGRAGHFQRDCQKRRFDRQREQQGSWQVRRTWDPQGHARTTERPKDMSL
jgi:hypothetical protein